MSRDYGSIEKGNQNDIPKKNIEDEIVIQPEGENLPLLNNRRLPASKGQVVEYWGGRITLWLAFGGELFYGIFTTIDGAKGLKLFMKETFGVDTPELAAYITAGILAALDYDINVNVLKPKADSLKTIGLEEVDGILYEKKKDMSEEEEKRHNWLSLIAFRVIPQLFGQLNFIDGCLTDAIAAEGLMKWIHKKTNISLEAARYSAIGLGIFLSLTGYAYYNFLSFSDVNATVDDFRDFDHSPIKALYRYDKKMFYMALSKGIITHLFRFSAFFLITNQLLDESLPWLFNVQVPEEYKKWLSLFFASCGGITSVLTRTLPPFGFYLPFDQYNSDTMKVVSPNEQLTIKGMTLDQLKKITEISKLETIQLFVPGVVLGAIRSLPVGWIIFSYVNEAIQSYVPSPWHQLVTAVASALVSSGIFYHAVVTDYNQALNQLLKDKGTDAKITHSGIIKLSSIGTMVGSQSVRGFVAILSGKDLWEGNGIELQKIVVGYSAVAGEVGWTNGQYLYKKATKNLADQFSDMKNDMQKVGRKLGGFLTCKPCRKSDFDKTDDVTGQSKSLGKSLGNEDL